MAEKLDFMSIFDYDPNFQNLMTRMLENAIEHSFHGIMITRAEPGYPVVYVNKAFSQLTGYSSEEIIGKSPAILQGHGEAINYRKDGSEFVMEWKIVPIKNEKEVTSHYLALQRDVTQFRESQ